MAGGPDLAEGVYMAREEMAYRTGDIGCAAYRDEARLAGANSIVAASYRLCSPHCWLAA